MFEVDQVDDGVDQGKQGEDHATPLVVAHVKVQGDKLVDTKPPERSKKVTLYNLTKEWTLTKL